MVKAVGIDLGTTYTVVAALEDARPAVIPNAEGQRLTPSVVAFARDGAPLVGQAAKLQAWANPERTVFSVKRRMGADRRLWVGERAYTPEGLSSLILRKVKHDAEAYLGTQVKQTVITVPAYFNDLQRQATREAGRLAGLDVLRIINEPTAAALAYGLEREDAHTVLVWDLGGGTFDVSILELGEGIFEVRAAAGDSRLGGDDFDQRIAAHLAAQSWQAYGEDFPADARAWQALREAAEAAKIRLSTAATTRVFVPCVGAAPAASHLDLVLTRAELEHITADLLGRLVAPTQQALADAGLAPEDIDRVVLVGGSTRMPAVRALVRRLIGREPYRAIDPDEVVAMGAAIQAGMLLGLIERITLLDVLPLSLGVETQGGLFARLIPRNTQLPAATAQVFTTAVDNQTAMDIHVLQGERALAADNVSLGRFQLSGIPAAPRGAPKVEVAFAADVDGLVHVTAGDLATERTVEVKLGSAKVLDTQEIEQLTAAALGSAEQDGEQRERVQATIEADNAIAAAEMALQELAGPSAGLQEVAGPQVHALVAAVRQVKEALAAGSLQDIRRRCREVRQQLRLMPRERVPGRA